MNGSTGSLRAALLGVALLPCGVIAAHAATTCTSDPMILACFEAYETDLRSFHAPQLDAIADRIAESRAWKVPLDHVTVIGHAAKYKVSDPVDEDSRKRADTVAKALAQRLAARGIRGVRIEQARVGASMPRATNSTKEGRALNRRAEVFLEHRGMFESRSGALRDVCVARKGKAEVRSVSGDAIRYDVPCLREEQALAICNANVTLAKGGRLEGAACLPAEVRCVVCRKP